MEWKHTDLSVSVFYIELAVKRSTCSTYLYNFLFFYFSLPANRSPWLSLISRIRLIRISFKLLSSQYNCISTQMDSNKTKSAKTTRECYMLFFLRILEEVTYEKELHSHLYPTIKNQVWRRKYAPYCWIIQDKSIDVVLLWTPWIGWPGVYLQEKLGSTSSMRTMIAAWRAC